MSIRDWFVKRVLEKKESKLAEERVFKYRLSQATKGKDIIIHTSSHKKK